MMHQQWDTGYLLTMWIVGSITAVCLLAVIIGIVAMRYSDSSIAPGATVVGGFFGVIGLIVLAVVSLPWSGAYHRYIPVTGTVQGIQTRFLGDGNGGTTQVFPVQINGQTWKCNDTRCAQLHVGDRVTLMCEKQFQFNGTPGYDCNWGALDSIAQKQATFYHGRPDGNTLTAFSGYPNPNGKHWHCLEYKDLYSWDCIAGEGFLYGGMWAFVSDYYQHPNPDTNYVVNETYFNQNSPNGISQTSQWRHRVVMVDDGAMKGIIMPFNWRVSAGQTNPPAPTECLVLTGVNQGLHYPCSTLDQKSVLDYWAYAGEIPNQDAW